MKTLILASAVLLSLSVTPLIPVQADSTGETSTILELQKNEDPTKPVDPTDPGKDEDPDDEDNPPTNNQGELTLDVAPKAFNFGQVKMDVTEQTYTADPTGTGNQYIQVTDKRGADQTGWAVSAKQSQILTEQNPTGTAHQLTGSTITVPAGEARNSLNNPTTAIDSKLETNSIDIADSNEATIFKTTAAPGAGKGTSVNNWNPENVELTIPQNTAKKGEYLGEITWTLAAETKE